MNHRVLERVENCGSTCFYPQKRRWFFWCNYWEFEMFPRPIKFFSEEPTVCNVEVVDDDCIVLRTAYSGMNFREEIRLLEDDTIRLRQTLGFKDGSNKPFLYGSYLEERIN